MSIEDYSTYREIKTQTEAWEQALAAVHGAALPEASGYKQVIFTGCGSTYYLSLAAAALYQELTGRAARAVPAGELLLNPQTSLTSERTLLIGVSRSGTTTETVKAVEKFRRRNQGEVLVISNYGRTLGELADTEILIPSGQEDSVAQTRSFSSMFVAASALCARMAGRQDMSEAMSRLPEAGRRLMEGYEGFAKGIGEDLGLDRCYFLGSGPRYGLACEANLKMKEMTLTHSEAFHFLEFRHGPMSMVTENTLIVGMLAEKNRAHELEVLAEMQGRGGRTVALAELEADVSFASSVPEGMRGVLYLPVLQFMACYRSLAKGLNPDRPRNLTAVVQLDL